MIYYLMVTYNALLMIPLGLQLTFMENKNCILSVDIFLFADCVEESHIRYRLLPAAPEAGGVFTCHRKSYYMI